MEVDRKFEEVVEEVEDEVGVGKVIRFGRCDVDWKDMKNEVVKYWEFDVVGEGGEVVGGVRGYWIEDYDGWKWVLMDWSGEGVVEVIEF